MSRQWTVEENEIFIAIMDDYREKIENTHDKEIKNITWKIAEELNSKHGSLKDRTIQGIYEHLSYFDDLLAGVNKKEDFAIKDGKYFATKRRKDNNIRQNPARVIRSSKKSNI